MKRDPRLVPMSREHHAALRLGRQLVAGAGRDALRAQHAELLAHFAEEEVSLLPVLHAHGHVEVAERLCREHHILTTLFASALRGERQAEAGKALIAHVRFEERELFPLLETLFDGVPA